MPFPRAAALAVLAASPALAQLRVATWNISNYAGGRESDLRTAAYGAFEDRSLAPDVLIVQEMTSQAAVDALLAILDDAPNGPGDWAAAEFYSGNDTDNACFYRTGRVACLGMTRVAIGGNPPNHPRDVNRYDIRPVGYSTDAAVIAVYSSHMKAGSGGDDLERRLLEAQRIRDDAESLPAPWAFILGGDFNIQSSAQAAYTELVGSQSNNDGRFVDPINTPGAWNNNSAYRFVHTQDPVGAGGMDDRHDQLLISADLADIGGPSYIGDAAVPYSTSTWNDPNHSYRSWGNDGTSFNNSLTVNGNTMVGAAIAQALKNVANGAGHLPVYLDLRVGAAIAADSSLDFGQVEVGSTAEQALTVANSGDTALWTEAGIATLNYTLEASAGFSAPAGNFSEPPGDAGNAHTISMDTTTPGPKSGTITITSDATDTPVLVVTLIGEVVEPGCIADMNDDGILNVFDFLTFSNYFAKEDPRADVAAPFGVFNVFDFLTFQNLFAEGC